MHPYLRRMITDRARRGRGRRDYGGEYRVEMEGDYARRGRRDYGHDEYDDDYARGGYGGRIGTRGRTRDYNDYGMYDEYEEDGRRGVKYTGPYGIGGRRYYGRDRGRYDDYEDYGEDEMKLDERDMEEWKKNLENADGTRGAHFSMPQIRQASQALGLRMDGRFDEKDLCMASNMIYSDYCDVLSKFIPKDKEAMVYVKLAKAFLDDPDAAVQGKEKLAAYFYAIVDGMDDMR